MRNEHVRTIKCGALSVGKRSDVPDHLQITIMIDGMIDRGFPDNWAVDCLNKLFMMT